MKNAGFSSAEKTWLPAHWNYNEINVEKESQEEDSLLNGIRTLLKIRNEERSLQEGSLEILEELPEGVFGYIRKIDDEKIIILLNFDEQMKEFQMEFSKCIFKLSDQDEAKEKAIRLNSLGGVILKHTK